MTRQEIIDKLLNRELEVTQEDIDTGVPSCSWRCPVARRIRKEVDDRAKVTVGIEIRVGFVSFAMPPQLMRWIDGFDSTGDVSPVRFTLTEVLP